MYRTYGLTSLDELFGDRIVYRNLTPADRRLPSLSQLQRDLGMDDRTLPRKAEPAYGMAVAEMLRCARRLDKPGGTVRRLVYIGDTQMNDSTAFRSICAAAEWPGWAFIGRDEPRAPAQTQVDGALYLCNRWSALPDFLRFVEQDGFALDEETAVVIDVDKTAIGARGRNDRVIDQARVDAVQHTVADLLGPSFDQAAFDKAYDTLRQATYHPFTADNQDYLAYICLMLGAGLSELETVVHRVQEGSMRSFADFITEVQGRRSDLARSGLIPVHDEVWHRFQQGDPTPFKTFRYNEYLTTIARFGDLPEASIEEVLAQRIVITEEVRQAAIALRGRGVLTFGVSDKPDEASLPNETQAQAGMEALHRLATLAVGEA